MQPQTRYKFNAGTALEESFDVDYYETFFREYDAQIGRFTGVDAMSEKTIAQSPYQFAINNPISFNDPTGLKIDYKRTRGDLTIWNPNFGRNESGGFVNNLFDLLPGESAFGAYWNNVISSGLDLGVNISVTNNGDGTFGGVAYLDRPLTDALNQIVASIVTARNVGEALTGTVLSNGGSGPVVGLEVMDNTDIRPDADGFITKGEAIDWYRNGNGAPLYANLNQLDLSHVYASDFHGGIGSNFVINFALMSSIADCIFHTKMYDQGWVYGQLRLVLTGPNEVQAYQGYENYDFDMKSWSNISKWGRNFETMYGAAINGNGIPFRIYLQGSAYIASEPMPIH